MWTICHTTRLRIPKQVSGTAHSHLFERFHQVWQSPPQHCNSTPLERMQSSHRMPQDLSSFDRPVSIHMLIATHPGHHYNQHCCIDSYNFCFNSSLTTLSIFPFRPLYLWIIHAYLAMLDYIQPLWIYIQIHLSSTFVSGQSWRFAWLCFITSTFLTSLELKPDSPNLAFYTYFYDMHV